MGSRTIEFYDDGRTWRNTVSNDSVVHSASPDKIVFAHVSPQDSIAYAQSTDKIHYTRGQVMGSIQRRSAFKKGPPTPPPPPPPPTDPYFSNVVALLHMDGTNGSTTFTDQIGNIWTPETGVVVSTSQSKFGGASGRFEVAAKQNRLVTPSRPDFNFGTGQFTVEGWFYITGTPASALVFFAKDNNASASTREYSFRFTTSSGTVTGVQTLLFNSSGGYSLITHSAAIALNQWHHVAITRDSSNTLRSFLNGTVIGSTVTATGRTEATSTQVTIGGDTFNTDPARYQGFIDEFRVTKGISRYTADFTPPTDPFPDQ